MGKYSKLMAKILAGSADGNVEFSTLRQFLIRLGFEERVKGGRHTFLLGMALTRSSIFSLEAVRLSRIS